MRKRRWRTGLRALAGAALLLAAAVAQGAPAPPTDVSAADKRWDKGETAVLTWTLSADDPAGVEAYKILRSLTEAEIAADDAENLRSADKTARKQATDQILGETGLAAGDEIPPGLLVRIREARASAAAEARAAVESVPESEAGFPRYRFVTFIPAGQSKTEIQGLHRGSSYHFQVIAVGKDKSLSTPAFTAKPVVPARWPFDGSRFALGVITALLCVAVIYFIGLARKGQDLKIRKIAGLEAVHEAVGRATEMGRPVLFIPGIQDMNEIQTIAGLTILSRVAKTAAEYDARIEVPTTRSLVMTAARETVQASYLSVGRPDAYNQDSIYYVTDEQFGYVAYVSGHMVREKPAACFYMGAFFAESLILAETGNSIGAIQVAGTAMPAQLPFFVAACDYTLIGEEFFAASAYLSGEPEQLGSLKGQDVGKVIVAVILVIGVALATIGTMLGSGPLLDLVDFIQSKILT